MTLLIAIAGLILLLLLLGQVRLGGEVEYSETGVTAYVRLGCFNITVYPAKEKKKTKTKKEKKPKKKKPKETGQPQEEPAEETKKKRGGTLKLLKKLLPVALEAAAAFKRKLRVDRLVLHLTWAADNPASAAMGYGAANAAVGTIYPLLDQAFEIQKSDVGIDVDFQRTQPEIYLKAALTLTVGQLTALILHFGRRAIRIYFSQRTKQRRINQEKGN